MKKSIQVLFYFFIFSSSFGQQDSIPVESANESNGGSGNFSLPNTVGIELLGPGIFYSAFYERVIINQKRFKTSAQSGVSYGFFGINYGTFTVHLSVNEIISFNKNHLEVGFGCAYLSTNAFMPYGRLGYRYQKPDGKFMAKFQLTPGYIDDMLIPWIGISLGRNF